MASTSTATKNYIKGRGIWLVGGTLESITSCKLPSNQQVLRRFFNLHLHKTQIIQTNAPKAKIFTQNECHVIDKFKTYTVSGRISKKVLQN